MKEKMLFLFLCLLTTTTINAQSVTTDSVRLLEYLPVSHTDNLRWITRYQDEINLYWEANRNLTDTSCDVLFLGSSSINLWDNIYKDLAPLKVIRRSYGGATIRDMLYNYDTIARGFHPRSIAIYVENDLSGSNHDVSIGQVFDLFRILINRLQRDYPGIPIILLSLKPSFARKSVIPQ